MDQTVSDTFNTSARHTRSVDKVGFLPSVLSPVNKKVTLPTVSMAASRDSGQPINSANSVMADLLIGNVLGNKKNKKRAQAD